MLPRLGHPRRIPGRRNWSRSQIIQGLAPTPAAPCSQGARGTQGCWVQGGHTWVQKAPSPPLPSQPRDPPGHSPSPSWQPQAKNPMILIFYYYYYFFFSALQEEVKNHQPDQPPFNFPVQVTAAASNKKKTNPRGAALPCQDFGSG